MGERRRNYWPCLGKHLRRLIVSGDHSLAMPSGGRRLQLSQPSSRRPRHSPRNSSNCWSSMERNPLSRKLSGETRPPQPAGALKARNKRRPSLQKRDANENFRLTGKQQESVPWKQNRNNVYLLDDIIYICYGGLVVFGPRAPAYKNNMCTLAV